MIMDSIYNFNITRFSCCLTVTRRVPLVVQEWLILAEYLSSPTVFSEFCVVKCVSFLGSNMLTIVLFSPLYCQTKDYIIGICCFSTKKGVKAQTGWLGIRIIFASGATYLPADCCFSEITL